MQPMKLPDWLNAERGRKSALAAHLSVPPSFVIKMATGIKPIPLDHCPAIQDFTGGAVTCEELRPDKADYFAMIRAQAVARATTAPAAINSVAPRAERRVSTTPNPFPDLDRRAATQGVT